MFTWQLGLLCTVSFFEGNQIMKQLSSLSENSEDDDDSDTEESEIELFQPLHEDFDDGQPDGVAVLDELVAVQGKAVDIGGYYYPDRAKVSAVMRPSATFNAALDSVKG